MDKSDQADSQGKGVKKLNRFRILLLSLAVMWWGYISYLCLSIWPGYLPVLMTFGLVVLSVVIAVCWKLLLPVGDNKFVVRNSICIIVFMLITGFACNQFVHREEQARQRRSTTPEIRQLAETVTYHLLDQSYINYKDFQKTLLQGELSPSARKSLQDNGTLAQTSEALEAKFKGLKDSKQIVAVHVNTIAVRDRDNNGYFPVDVTGRIATQSVSAAGFVEEPFSMHYSIGKNSEAQQAVVAEVSREISSKEIEPGDQYDSPSLEAFARRVARHLVDSSYISYEDNTKALLLGELSSSIVRKMIANGDLPKNSEEMKSVYSILKQDQQVIAVRFDDVSVGEPNEQGLVSVAVKGQMAVGSKTRSDKLHPFSLTMLIGTNAETDKFVVAELSEKD